MGVIKSTKASLDGYSFASKLEASVYQLLKFRKLAGEISVIETQHTVRMGDAEMKYIVDFLCTLPNGELLFVEAKGYPDRLWAQKKRQWKVHGAAPLEVWGGHHTNPKLLQIIVPRPIKKTCPHCHKPLSVS